MQGSGEARTPACGMLRGAYRDGQARNPTYGTGRSVVRLHLIMSKPLRILIISDSLRILRLLMGATGGLPSHHEHLRPSAPE